MDLNELLQHAQRLTNDTKMDTELPRVERTISQVLQETQELHSRVTQNGTNDLQAHKLMGSKGIDLPGLTQKLESLSARKTFEPLDPVSDTDVRGYLRNERENIILSLIEETNCNVFESVEKRKWRYVYAEWGEEKERLLNALVGPKQEEFPEVQRQRVPTVLNQEPIPYSRLNRIEMLYAEEIANYNQMSIQGDARSGLVTKFKTLAQSFSDEAVLEMWSVLAYMVNVTPPSRDADPIKIRQTSPQFVQQARNYLERRYKIYMNTIIEQNLVTAERGGIPSSYNLVKSFVRVTFKTPVSLVGLTDMMDGHPLWPLVYYSLRCGDWAAAIQFLNQARSGMELATLMEQKQNANVDQKNGKVEGQLKLEYSNKMRVGTDPYKKAVYAIVLACDPNESHANVVRTIDDFLWLKLSVLRNEKSYEYNVEQLTYGGLQSLILEKYGESYFNARDRAPLYFQVLALTGQFESAIEFLARTQANRPHAVHMAIALNELHMLGTPVSVEKPLLIAEPSDPPPMRRLNLARLIIMYAKAFEQTDTAEALQYYYLLRSFKDSDGRNLFLACVCDLLVDNYEESMMQLVFGMPEEPDSWCYSGGIFAQFNTVEFDKYTLAGMVGDELSQRGNFEPAIKLYYVGSQMDKALKVACSLLAQVVHQRTRQGTMRERLFAVTQKMNAALEQCRTELEGHTVATYKMLSQLMLFFDYYHAGEHRMAGEVLANHKIMPSRTDDVNDCLGGLKRVGSEVIKVLPDVLLAAMDIVYQEYGRIKSANVSGIGSKEISLGQLRERAKALTNMAATVPYRMPTDINKRLVQMEIMMN